MFASERPWELRPEVSLCLNFAFFALIKKNMLKNIFFVFILSGLLLFISCSTYIIHLQSFKEQFDGMDTSKLIDVIVQGPMYEKYHYRANSISTIQCRDKDDVPSELQNSPSIEARFTYG